MERIIKYIVYHECYCNMDIFVQFNTKSFVSIFCLPTVKLNYIYAFIIEEENETIKHLNRFYNKQQDFQ